MKVERYEGFDSYLYQEYKIYKDIAGCVGISKAYWYAIEGSYSVMVIDRFDVSLDELVRRSDMLDMPTVVSFADQMVSTCIFHKAKTVQ